MKILHVIPYFAAAYGGPVQAVRDIARMQAESGIAVEIATTRANGATELSIAECEPVVAGNVRVHYFERTFPRSWFRSVALQNWVIRHVADYNGLHLHVPFTFPLHCAARAAQRAGVPYAITPHGVLDPWSLAHKRWKKIPYVALVERAHLAGARLIHVTSALEAQGLRALGVTDTVRRIPLAVTLLSAAPRRTMQRQGLRLLFLSRLHPVKDLETLLGAIAQLKRPGIRLTIAGEGELHYVRRLRNLLHQLGIHAAVDFTGHLDNGARLVAWREHDVFIMPSLHENFSLSTVEAMAAGMPVIVSDQVGVADRIGAAGAGLVVASHDAAALAAAITSLSDEPTRSKAGFNARRLVSKEFSNDVLRAAYTAFAVTLSAGA